MCIIRKEFGGVFVEKRLRIAVTLLTILFVILAIDLR